MMLSTAVPQTCCLSAVRGREYNNDMAATISYLPTTQAVEAAWERYRILAAQLAENPRLCADRGHMEALKRAERAWTAAFNAMDDAA